MRLRHRVATVLLSAGVLTHADAQDSPLKRHDGAAYERDAVHIETLLRKQIDAPMRVEFHRDQAFRSAVAGKAWRVLSVAWLRDGGGDTHCVLTVLHGERTAHVDALAGEVDPAPWSCDAEPAMRIADLDADRCPEILALYPMRPPSGERFSWPLVLRCDASRFAWELDSARTRRLREALSSAPLTDLRRAEALLRAAPAQ